MFIQYVITLALCLFSILRAVEREPSLPYISGDTFASFCRFSFDDRNQEIDPFMIEEGDLIFVKSEYLQEFFSTIHPKIHAHYILITHNSDKLAPCLGKKTCPLMDYLNDDQLIAWFGFNLESNKHSKLHTIPIGVANRYLTHGDVLALQEVEQTAPLLEKTILLYGNFSRYTYRDERDYVYTLFKDKDYCTYASFKPFKEYLLDLAKTKFVLSPRGFCLDCFRTWESLLMGAIPIVKTSSLDCLYEGLPVLIVNDWNEISEEFLIKKYEEMKMETYQIQKMYIFYWINLIKSYAKPFKREANNL